MFSLKYEFPTEWHKFRSQPADTNGRFPLSFEIKDLHYPFWSQGRVNSVQEVEVFAVANNAVTFTSPTDTSKSFSLTKDSTLSRQVYPGKQQDVYSKKWENIALPEAIGNISLLTDRKDMDDVWVVVRWAHS